MNETKFNGNKLLLIRKGKNMSQDKLAELVGVTRQTIYLWESNQSLPDVEKVSKLCNILNVTLSDLVDDLNEDNSLKENKVSEIVNDVSKKRFNISIVKKIFVLLLIIFIFIYIIVSVIKFLRLRDIVNKWNELNKIDNYYFSYTELLTDENGAIEKELQYIEKNLKDNVITTNIRNLENPENSCIMIDNYNTNERIVINEVDKTYRKSILEFNSTALVSQLPSTFKMLDYNNIVLLLTGFNLKISVKSLTDMYVISNGSLTIYIHKDTGLIKEEVNFNKNSKEQNFIKEYSIKLNASKDFGIDLSDYVEINVEDNSNDL